MKHQLIVCDLDMRVDPWERMVAGFERNCGVCDNPEYAGFVQGAFARIDNIDLSPDHFHDLQKKER